MAEYTGQVIADEYTGPVVSEKSHKAGRVLTAEKVAPQQQRNRQVVAGAGNEAVAAIPDMLLNAPANVGNLGAAAYHFASGSDEPFKPPFQQPNIASRLMRAGGFTNPEWTPQNADERMLAGITQGAVGGATGGLGGAGIGALSGAIGQGVTEKTGSPEWGTVAGMATYPAANMVGNAARRSVAMADKLRGENAAKVATMKELRDAGYTIPPAETNPTFVNRFLSTIAGKTPLRQEASLANDSVTNDLIRKEIGLAQGTAIDESAMGALVNQRSQPYRDVASLPGLPAKQVGTAYLGGSQVPMMGKKPTSPADLLRDWQDTNARTKDYWREHDRNFTVDAKEKAVASQQRADALAAQIEQAAVAQGKPELVDRLKNARVDLAKIGTVERASNLDRGEGSAIALEAARKKGVPLTGGLETAATMGNAFPQSVQSPRTIGTPTGSNLATALGSGTAAGLGTGAGYLLGGPAGSVIGGMAGGAIGGALPMMTRKMLLSKLYQNKMGTPDFNPGMLSKELSKLPLTPADMATIRGYIMSEQLKNQGEQ
jgi:hypothetical protein